MTKENSATVLASGLVAVIAVLSIFGFNTMIFTGSVNLTRGHIFVEG